MRHCANAKLLNCVIDGGFPSSNRAIQQFGNVLAQQSRNVVSAMHLLDNLNLAVVGLGYVGLPLAVEFGKRFDTTGYDIHPERVRELQQGRDRTLELTAE